jgi:hypothetical protein
MYRVFSTHFVSVRPLSHLLDSLASYMLDFVASVLFYTAYVIMGLLILIEFYLVDFNSTIFFRLEC